MSHLWQDWIHSIWPKYFSASEVTYCRWARTNSWILKCKASKHHVSYSNNNMQQSNLCIISVKFFRNSVHNVNGNSDRLRSKVLIRRDAASCLRHCINSCCVFTNSLCSAAVTTQLLWHVQWHADAIVADGHNLILLTHWCWSIIR